MVTKSVRYVWKIMKPNHAHSPENLIKKTPKAADPSKEKSEEELADQVKQLMDPPPVITRDMFGDKPFDMEFLGNLEEYMGSLGADMDKGWASAVVALLGSLDPAHTIVSDKVDRSTLTNEPFKLDKKDKFWVVEMGPGDHNAQKALREDPDLLNAGLSAGSLDQLSGFVEERFPGLDFEQLLLTAFQAFMAAFDPGLHLSEPTVVAKLNEIRMNKGYGGLGVMLREDGDGFRVAKMIAKGPAEKGKMKIEDRIVSIGGRDCKDLTLPQAAFRLRGKAGDTVEIEIEREGKASKLKIKRAEVESFAITQISGVNLHQDDDDGWLNLVGA